MEATETNNTINNIENLLINTQINNHGEVRESSSFSSFNEMLKDLFPQTHTTNTSLEEIDTASNEASPDYYSDTNHSNFNDLKDETSYLEKETSEKETVSMFEEQNSENNYEKQLEDNSENKTYSEAIEDNQKKDETQDTRNYKEDDNNKEDGEKTSKIHKNDTKDDDKKIEDNNKKLKKEEVEELKKDDEDENKIKENKLLAELINLLKELNKLINKNFQNSSDNKNKISTSSKELKDKLNKLTNSPEFKNILNQLKKLKNKFQKNPHSDQTKKITELLKKLNNKELSKIILEKIDGEQDLNQNKNSDILKDLLSEILKFSEQTEKKKEIKIKNDTPVEKGADKKNIKIISIDSKTNIKSDIKKNILQPENNNPLKENSDEKSSKTQDISDKPLILKESIKPLKSTNTVDLNAPLKENLVETEANNLKSLETKNLKVLNDSDIKKTVSDLKDSSNSNSGKDTNTNLFNKTIADLKTSSDTKALSKANPKFTSYLTKAFDAEENILNKIVSQATLRLNGSRKEINFNLTPPELGEVKVSLKEQNGILTARIKVDNEVIKEIVESNISILKNSLNQHLKIDRLEVEVKDDAEQKNLNSSADDYDLNKKSGNNQDKDINNSNLYYNDNLNESFGLNIPVPEGVQINENGLTTVDLIG